MEETKLRPSQQPLKAPGGIFYGWWIVISCGILQFFGAGFFYYGLGAFLLPVVDTFGWSRLQVSSAFSLHRLEGGVIAPLVGYAFDRWGSRKLAIFGVGLIGLGFLGMSQVQDFAGFVAAVLVMSLGYGSAFTANTMATVANWFNRKRATALGIVMAGSGCGGLLVPILSTVIELQGWRLASAYIGIVFLLVGLPLVMVLRTRPEGYGLLPDGRRIDRPLLPRSSIPSLARAARATAIPIDEVEISIRDTLRSRAFWALAIASSLCAVSQSALVVHAIAFLTDSKNGIGLETTLAAGVIGAMSVISVIGRLAFGWMADRYEKRKIGAIVYGLQAAGMLVFALATTPLHIFGFLALFSPGYGGMYPLRPAIQGECFGRRSFGTVQGLLLGVNALAGVFGPSFAGWMFDQFDSYRLAFIVMAALAALAVPVILMMPKATTLRPKAA